MFAVLCLVVRAAQALGMSAYLTASYAILSVEYRENVSFAFVCSHWQDPLEGLDNCSYYFVVIWYSYVVEYDQLYCSHEQWWVICFRKQSCSLVNTVQVHVNCGNACYFTTPQNFISYLNIRTFELAITKIHVISSNWVTLNLLNEN